MGELFKDHKDQEARDVLPSQGMMTITDLAKFLGMDPWDLSRNLRKKGVPIVNVGSRLLSKRMIKLETL